MMKKLLPLFGVLVVALIAISTGAFTSVTATRDATIMVAGDASALLALASCTGPNGAYVGYDNDGALFLDSLPTSPTQSSRASTWTPTPKSTMSFPLPKTARSGSM